MDGPQNIILVGFMASGKTETGKTLAHLTGWPLVDTDAEIVANAGRPIHQIFQEEGEPAFRALETKVIQELCTRSGQIIATGGGAFVSAANQTPMLAAGLVFCLNAQPESIHQRITKVASVSSSQRETEGGSVPQQVRPLLAEDSQLTRIQELLAQRAHAYAQAHFTVDTDELTPVQVARHILDLCGPELKEL